MQAPVGEVCESVRIVLVFREVGERRGGRGRRALRRSATSTPTTRRTRRRSTRPGSRASCAASGAGPAQLCALVWWRTLPHPNPPGHRQVYQLRDTLFVLQPARVCLTHASLIALAPHAHPWGRVFQR